MTIRIDDHKHPGRAKYYRAMGDKWMTAKEVSFEVKSSVFVVNTVLRRWEDIGIVERRKKVVTWGKPPIQWRWKNG